MNLTKALIPFSIIYFAADALAQGAGNPGWWQGVDTPAFAGGVIRQAHCDVLSYMGGSLGGMLMAAAGILAIATAAFGNFKHGITAVAVGIAAFTMSEMTELFFGRLCNAQGNATGVAGLQQGVDAAGPATGNITRTAFESDVAETDEEAAKEEDPFDL